MFTFLGRFETFFRYSETSPPSEFSSACNFSKRYKVLQNATAKGCWGHREFEINYMGSLLRFIM